MSVEEQIEELLNDLEQEDTSPMNGGTTLVSAENGMSTPFGGSLILSQEVHTYSAYGVPVAFCLTK